MFKPNKLFNLQETHYREIFHGVNYAWEAIPKIGKYIVEHIKPNKKAIGMGNIIIEGEVQIGEGTVIEPNVYIKGPAIIGRNCVIRQSAYIRGNALIGDNCVIGNSTEVKNAILFNHVAIPHFNYVGDSILGYKVHLGAGVILSNVKTPPREIHVITLEKKYDTGLIKFGALIGDNTEIGCNAVLNPGTILGQHCLIYPGVVFRGVAPDKAIVKLIQEQEIVIKLSTKG